MTLKGLNEDGELVALDDDEDEEVEKKIMVMNDTGACIGCGEALAIRQSFKALDNNVIVVNATGCAENRQVQKRPRLLS